MKSIQIFLEEFNYIPFGENPKILLQAWYKFFAIQHAQLEDSNELFQKLLEDLQIINKEMAEYVNSPSRDCPIFFNNNEDHYVQYKEYLENSSNEITDSNSNQEEERPPQDSDIRQLIKEECCIEVCEEKNQNMEDTILELVEICRQKELFCMHDNVDDLIESALNSKLLSINSQRLNMKKQEVKNVVEQRTERGTLHAITPILSTKEPEYSPSMGYEHLSTTPETELDEVTESSAKNLLPIPSEYEVTSEDESNDDESLSEEDVPIEESKDHSNPLFDNDEINSDELVSHVENFVESLSNHNALINSSQKIDHLEEFSGPLIPIHIAEEERIRKEHAEYISQREEIDIVTYTDELLPPGFENDDSEGEIDVVEELHVDNSISNSKNELSNNEASDFDNPSFPRPPPEPPDDEFDFELNFGKVISVVMNAIVEFECLDPRNENDVSTNDEDGNYFPFIFVIRIFLPYLIYPKVFPFLLSAESEDIIFDPGISV
nr:hypothetical protein [Tanacetum cinerariifolium]